MHIETTVYKKMKASLLL